MKFATIIACSMISAQAVNLERYVSLDDENAQVEDEFQTLSEGPSTDAFRVEVSSFGNQTNTCKQGDTATVNYTGKLADGRQFDSSIKEGYAQPFKFTIGASQVIKCWDDALGQMSSGEKATVTCPSDMAYGQTGAPGSIIGPNATLKFDIEVINCESGF